MGKEWGNKRAGVDASAWHRAAVPPVFRLNKRRKQQTKKNPLIAGRVFLYCE